MSILKLNQETLNCIESESLGVEFDYDDYILNIHLYNILNIVEFQSVAKHIQQLFDIQIQFVCYATTESSKANYTDLIDKIPLNSEGLWIKQYIMLDDLKIRADMAHIAGADEFTFSISYNLFTPKIPILKENKEFEYIPNPYYKEFQPKLKQLKKILEEELGDFKVITDTLELFKNKKPTNETKFKIN